MKLYVKEKLMSFHNRYFIYGICGSHNHTDSYSGYYVYSGVYISSFRADQKQCSLFDAVYRGNSSGAVRCGL